MNMNEYQAAADSTAVFPPVMVPDRVGADCEEVYTRMNIVYPTLGLSGEAGEFANKVKKVIRDNQGTTGENRRVDLLDELGDVLWYVAACATALDASLDTVARNNVKKLADRMERGKIQGEGDKR